MVCIVLMVRLFYDTARNAVLQTLVFDTRPPQAPIRDNFWADCGLTAIRRQGMKADIKRVQG